MFAQKLKKLRKERNMTQKQLAEKLFIDCSTVTKWETGKANPDFEKQRQLAELFKVSLDYLMGMTDFTDEENKNICANASLYLNNYEPYRLNSDIEYIFLPSDLITSIKKGLYKFTDDTLSFVAKALNISKEDLLKNNGFQEAISLDTQLTGVDFALWSETQDMTDAEKQDIIDYIQFRKTKRND